MKIVIKGTNNVNKGAELMFCAICQELEKRFPHSTVYISEISTLSPYNSNNLNIYPRNNRTLMKFISRFHIAGILRRIGINIKRINQSDYSPQDVDIYFNAGGYAVGDTWNHNKRSNSNQDFFLKTIKKRGTKIIFLPQAFGPFEKESSKNAIKIIVKYADLIYAREKNSYNYIHEACGDVTNVKIAPDFTTLIKGKLPEELAEYYNSIIIIPNKRMLMEKNVEIVDYINLIKCIIPYSEKLNKKIVILNHEGRTDFDICCDINKAFNNQFKVVSGLTALETKGFISTAYAVVSSRFHGTASCLSSAVPCISSSWNQKYEMLYSDYGLSNMIVELKDKNDVSNKIKHILDLQNNSHYRQILKERVMIIKEKNKQMWNEIFTIYEE